MLQVLLFSGDIYEIVTSARKLDNMISINFFMYVVYVENSIAFAIVSSGVLWGG